MFITFDDFDVADDAVTKQMKRTLQLKAEAAQLWMAVNLLLDMRKPGLANKVAAVAAEINRKAEKSRDKTFVLMAHQIKEEAKQ